MIIRSQDKKYLVNMGNISIYAMDREVLRKKMVFQMPEDSEVEV